MGLDDGGGDGDRFGGRRRTGGVTGADAVAALAVTRVCRSLTVVLMVGSCRRLRRACVQPLHRAPHEARGEEQQSERHNSAASEKRHDGEEHSAIPRHRLDSRFRFGCLCRWASMRTGAVVPREIVLVGGELTVVIVPGHAIRR